MGSGGLEGHRLALQLAEGDGVCAGGQRRTYGQVGAEPETKKLRAEL